MATDLGGSQISSLLETLPGIANVLRSPVADAMINVIRAASRLGEFNVSDAEELIHYATRRGLVGIPEGDQVLGDVRDAARKRMDKAVERGKATKAKAKLKTRSHKPKPKPKTKHRPRPKPAKKRKKR